MIPLGVKKRPGPAKEQNKRLPDGSFLVMYAFHPLPPRPGVQYFRSRESDFMGRLKYTLVEYLVQCCKATTFWFLPPGAAGEAANVGKVRDSLPKGIVSVQNAHNTTFSSAAALPQTTINSKRCPWLADDSLFERSWSRAKVCTRFRRFSRVGADTSPPTDPWFDGTCWSPLETSQDYATS